MALRELDSEISVRPNTPGGSLNQITKVGILIMAFHDPLRTVTTV